jgi:hypothetical protein
MKSRDYIYGGRVATAGLIAAGPLACGNAEHANHK